MFKQDTIQLGGGMPFGIEQVSNKELGIGGAYGRLGKKAITTPTSQSLLRAAWDVR